MNREKIIFVFGSNRAGRHGKGAALWARQHYGAKYGAGIGRTGNAFAIPTKGYHLEILPLSEIKGHVEFFIAYAESRPDLEFLVTRIGCGLAGYTDEQIGPMFATAPNNCVLPQEWKRYKEPL